MISTARSFGFFILLHLSIVSLTAQVDFQFEYEGRVLGMEERMSAEGTQGVAMVLLHNGEVLLQQNWGYRDTEAQLPVTDETVFQVGSLSQPLTRFAILKLVSSGVFDLDTDVNTYLKSWQLPLTPTTRRNPVTLRDLMLHRRGFNFPYKPKGFDEGASLPSLLDMLNGKGEANNPPVILKRDQNRSGDHTYAGTLLLQQILEDHYQLPFAELMDQEVLQPLGMTNSFFATELTKNQKKRLAIAYESKGKRLKGDYRRYAALSASGLYTTAGDWAIFIQHTLDAIRGKDNRMLSKEIAQEAMPPVDKSETLLFNQNETDYFWGGASKGYYTQFAADAVTQEWVVVAFMNDDLNWSFNGELRRQGKKLVEQTIATPKQVGGK